MLAGVLVGAAIAVIGTLAIVRSQQPTVSPTVSSAAPEPRASEIPVPVAPRVPATPVAEPPRDHALEDENAAQAAVISGAADFALPVQFPAGFPDAQRADVFRGVIDAAVRDCARGAKLAGVSCDEPPCIAVVGLGTPTDHPAAVVDCAAWERTYGRSTGAGGFNTVDCGDGRQEMVELISPELESWDGWKQLDEDTRGHIEARYAARVNRLLADYTCRPRSNK